ncbi:MAG TPA: energy transducer TonB [Candidatus Acidoferrales bacterium]|nr:energy transducer TonB [Candidatus Acidoferrales bacterium]
MRRIFGIATAIAALGSFTIAAGQGHIPPAPVFKSAELVSASDVPIPFNSVANGIVQVNAVIGKTGRVEGVDVVRELASVTEVTVAAVKKWEFTPGTMDGKPAVTRMAVAVVFCPPAVSSPQIVLQPLASPPGKGAANKHAIVPPNVISAEFPLNQTVVGGTVVLEAAVDPEGGLEYAKVVKDFPGLAAAALRSVNEKWKFSPASLKGKPVASKLIIAFAIRAPISNPI